MKDAIELVDDIVDIGLGAVAAEAEPDGAHADLRCYPHAASTGDNVMRRL